MYVDDGKFANTSENDSATCGKAGNQKDTEIAVKNYYNGK